MASLHRARKSVVQIVKTAQIPSSKCKRPQTQEYHVRFLARFLARFVLVLYESTSSSFAMYFYDAR